MSGQVFQVRVPGKWVLTGEHAVLRGATAVAIPHPELGLTLSFTPDSQGQLRVIPESAATVVRELLGTVEGFSQPSGTLKIESTIPHGAGLGSSAALCVALTRWLRLGLATELGISADQELGFATQLEHRFHGQSSGMDVAVSATGQPIAFVRGQPPKPLAIQKFPRFTFHDTGLRSRTSDCIVQVERFRETKPVLAAQTDEAMGRASLLAIEGLTHYDAGGSSHALAMIAQAMNQAQECFAVWQLVPSEALGLIQQLVGKGALAAKLTGAGGGGFVVALWPDSPYNP